MNKKLIKKSIYTILLTLFLSAPILASAAGMCGGIEWPCNNSTTIITTPSGTTMTVISNPCGFCDVVVIINNILRFVFFCIAPWVILITVIVAAIRFVVVGIGTQFLGSDTLKKAKDALLAVVVGILIIFIGWIFLNTLLDKMGAINFQGIHWWVIECNH